MIFFDSMNQLMSFLGSTLSNPAVAPAFSLCQVLCDLLPVLSDLTPLLHFDLRWFLVTLSLIPGLLASSGRFGCKKTPSPRGFRQVSAYTPSKSRVSMGSVSVSYPAGGHQTR